MILDDDVLTEEEKEFINREIVYSRNIPFYYNIDYNPKLLSMCHVLLPRHEEEPFENRINSHYFYFFYNILLRFCYKHNLEINFLLRGAINLAFYVPGHEKYYPHFDHFFPHYNFLLYLNDLPFDVKYNSTIVYNQTIDDTEVLLPNHHAIEEKLTIKEEVYPKFGRAFCFPGNVHSVRIPTPEHFRYVCVFTFR